MYLKLLQKINNILYALIGTSGIVIDFQAYINNKRHENDEIDKKEILLYDDEQPIVQ